MCHRIEPQKNNYVAIFHFCMVKYQMKKLMRWNVDSCALFGLKSDSNDSNGRAQLHIKYG